MRFQKPPERQHHAAAQGRLSRSPSPGAHKRDGEANSTRPGGGAGAATPPTNPTISFGQLVIFRSARRPAKAENLSL